MTTGTPTNAWPQRPPISATRKNYVPPVLSLFGQVAALTQNSGCSSNGDSATNCTPGAMGGSMVTSDRRAKENVVRVGTHPMGFGLYLFHYRKPFARIHGAGRHFGVMADEVHAVFPAAVSTGADGFSRVCYEMLGIRGNTAATS